MKRSALKPSTKPMSRNMPMARAASEKAASKESYLFKVSKPLKAKPKRHTKAESAYLGAVADLGCALCQHLGYGKTPAIVHHQRTGTGMMRASHYRTVPLCPHHHQFSGEGVHDMGREEFAEKYGISEVQLVENTRHLLESMIPNGE